MKKIRGILFLIIGVIAIGLGIKAFGMSAAGSPRAAERIPDNNDNMTLMTLITE